MQFKRAHQTDAEKIADRVFAAMETGNHGQARTVLQEYAEVDPAAANMLRTQVTKEYGVVL